MESCGERSYNHYIIYQLKQFLLLVSYLFFAADKRER